MNAEVELPEAAAEVQNSAREDRLWRKALAQYSLTVSVLALAFWRPLYDLARYSLKSELYSHVLLMPGIVLYLVWLRRAGIPRVVQPWAKIGWVLVAVGAVALGGYGLGRLQGFRWERDDYLSLTIGAFVCWVVGGGLLVLGRTVMRAVAFPAAMLVCLVPFPVMVVQGIEIFFQHTSTTAAHAMFVLSGTPVLRVGTTFQLPGLAIRVAEECSGIRSSLVLFITSLLAGYMFLRSPWRRAVLTLAVIPLAIIRNGFRVFTVSMLTIHVDPNVIHGPLHHHGGPLFFALSLAPFFVLLLWLRRGDRKAAASLMNGAAATGQKNHAPPGRGQFG